MAPITRRKVKLICCRSNALTKMAVAVVIVLSMAALLSLGQAKQEAHARISQLRQQAETLTRENSGLRDRISILGTPESVEQIAREELGMAKPGTVFFRPENNQP